MRYRIQRKLNAEGGHYFTLETRERWFNTWWFRASFTSIEHAEAEVAEIRNKRAKPVTIEIGKIE